MTTPDIILIIGAIGGGVGTIGGTIALIFSSKAKKGTDFNTGQMKGAVETIEQLQVTVKDLREENVIIRAENKACKTENTQLRFDVNSLTKRLDSMGIKAMDTVQAVVDAVKPPE